jgi:hypothetical protein
MMFPNWSAAHANQKEGQYAKRPPPFSGGQCDWSPDHGAGSQLHLGERWSKGWKSRARSGPNWDWAESRGIVDVRSTRIAALIAAQATLLAGQGFGVYPFRKSVTLASKLPAAVSLPAGSINVKVSAQNAAYRDVASRLQSMIETELVRFDRDLTLADAPDTIISASIQNFNIPPPAPVADPYGASIAASQNNNNKKNGQAPPQAMAVTGTLVFTYQARTRTGRVLDSEPIAVKFYEEVNTVTKTKSILKKIEHPTGSKDDEDNPQTLSDVEQILVNRAAARVAARLVNTNETVRIHLARGALDGNNRYAEAGQWTHFVETLETMAPLTKPEDDSYRLYNIGVGNEALGYKAETPAQARRYFEQAVIDYRKAGELNPREKYFIEPVNRIQLALEHYKKLAAPPATAKKATK